ncbi:hypothetical protein S101468_03098 (plasmid) [Acetobacter pasteurianus subsp. pasteurianus]|uniref:Resolvase/invertase-type recombinase catalytic domain-containing protein n=5 Tax=Acetobacter pasteurianus TaxID=438 RepID=A0AAC9X3T9_ACEPA|nr:hypothetical protein S101468_03098 [Acetobacter pasteurianus subsp. pasteurianus]
MVRLSTNASGQCYPRSLTTQNATVVLAEPWTDTTTSTGRLMLAVLGGLADVERDLIRTRTSEGRIRAIRQGKKWDVLVA